MMHLNYNSSWVEYKPLALPSVVDLTGADSNATYANYIIALDMSIRCHSVMPDSLQKLTLDPVLRDYTIIINALSISFHFLSFCKRVEEAFMERIPEAMSAPMAAADYRRDRWVASCGSWACRARQVAVVPAAQAALRWVLRII